jgi:serine/threonine protein kinase
MLKVGFEIKEYTLKKFLGRGGFGEVWLAEKKIELADRKVSVALKFLSGENQRISDYSSVRREINTWIDASGNRNVVSVLDGFLFENMFVIVSEYADNGSLRDWLRRFGGKSPNLEKTVEIMSGILDGLSHLHAQKIIHRDLKPENILLKGDVPCIADFGVSRMIETVSLTSSNFGTNSAGSPLYMSPESFERTKPAPQIDIWSAGVMLFEMLSGKTPYTADTIPALIYEIVSKEPRSLPADVPENIQNVVRKALSKELSERFQTAREMRDALMKAFYLQSQQTFAREEFITTRKKFASEDSFAQTVPLNSEKIGSEIGQSKNINSNKKLYGWVGLGAGAILAAAIGVLTITQSSNEKNPVQENITISNQTANSSVEVKKQENPEPVNTPKIEAAIDSQDNSDEITNSNIEKRKSLPDARAVKDEREVTNKKAASKTPKKDKKKVTLDDLIN